MPRLKLIHIPNGLYSVVSKCNNDEFLFSSSDKFELYLQHLLTCKTKLGFTIYDIVCMSNHVHELYRLSEKITIADILQYVKGQFSRKFNKKFGRKGHFWINKPFYRIVENEEYAFNTMNYFHWNPVKAGLVTKPEEWPYSGYKFHVLGKKDGLIGQLLDPLPGYFNTFKEDKRIQLAVAKILQNKKMRYLGSVKFRRIMRNNPAPPSPGVGLLKGGVHLYPYPPSKVSDS